jgi:hypothetical protein
MKSLDKVDFSLEVPNIPDIPNPRKKKSEGKSGVFKRLSSYFWLLLLILIFLAVAIFVTFSTFSFTLPQKLAESSVENNENDAKSEGEKNTFKMSLKLILKCPIAVFHFQVLILNVLNVKFKLNLIWLDLILLLLRF